MSNDIVWTFLKENRTLLKDKFSLQEITTIFLIIIIVRFTIFIVDVTNTSSRKTNQPAPHKQNTKQNNNQQQRNDLRHHC